MMNSTLHETGILTIIKGIFAEILFVATLGFLGTFICGAVAAIL